MGPTAVTWRPHQVPLKTFGFPEIGKETFIPRCSIGTAAMNRRELRGSHRCLLLGSAQRKWEKWCDPLIGVAPSASTVSRLNQTLTEQFEAWRQRPLQAHWRILYLDGVHFTVRHGDQIDPSIILTALGVDREGNKEVLAQAKALTHQAQEVLKARLEASGGHVRRVVFPARYRLPDEWVWSNRCQGLIYRERAWQFECGEEVSNG